MDFTIRLAEIGDVEAIEALMKRSMRGLGVGHYSDEQIDACCAFVCVPDLQLIEDRTFYVVLTHDGKMIGCGGWSFRNKMYAGPADTEGVASRVNPSTDPARIRAMFVDPEYSGKGVGTLILESAEKAAKRSGFNRGALGSTLSGFAFYSCKGWLEGEKEVAVLPNGTPIDVVAMSKPLI